MTPALRLASLFNGFRAVSGKDYFCRPIFKEQNLI